MNEISNREITVIQISSKKKYFHVRFINVLSHLYEKINNTTTGILI